MQGTISKLCSDIDDHFTNRCKDIINLLEAHSSEEESIYIVHKLISRIVSDCLNNFGRNKIKCVYLTVLVNVVNLHFNLLSDLFLSVMIRKFYFLVPLVGEGLVTTAQSPLHDPGSDFFWRRHESFSEMSLFALNEDTRRRFESFDRSREQDARRYEKLLAQHIKKDKTENFLLQLEVYSVLYFGILGLKYTRDYQVLVDFELMYTEGNLNGQNMYIEFFQRVLDKGVVDPLLGVVLLHSLRLFSEIWDSLDRQRRSEVMKTMRGIQGETRAANHRPGCPRNEAGPQFEELPTVESVPRVWRYFR